MKMSRSIVNSRREKVLELVRENGDITVNHLAEQFQVSPLTIRRDLQYLEDHKLLERFYGGARNSAEAGADLSENKKQLRRERIARYAASLVEDGDSIFINTSSTALAMLKYITSILLGGELRYVKGAMVGDFAMNNLTQVTARKSFMGCGGICPDTGMTTELLNEVNLNQTMFERVSKGSYILADCTKFGKRSSFVSCPPELIENIITDADAPAELVREFREKGTWVHQVD